MLELNQGDVVSSFPYLCDEGGEEVQFADKIKQMQKDANKKGDEKINHPVFTEKSGLV